MRTRHHFLVLFCTLLATAGAETVFHLEWLVPTPHDMTRQGDAVFHGKAFTLENALLPQDTMDYFCREAETRLGWKQGDKGIRVVIGKLPKVENDEQFELRLADDFVEIKAGTVAGAQRAAGRFLGLVEQLQIVPAETHVTLPGLTIRDYPDFPWRGLHFQYGQEWSEWRFTRMCQTIDMIARLGYNYVVFEIGGRVQCDAYPELVRTPAWPMEKIKAVLAFAKARGIRVYPAVNGPGHMASAPNLFPLRGLRNGRETDLIMNMAHPEFYRRWFAYLDCVHEAFGNPEYFCLGTDEFDVGVELFEKTTGRKASDCYIEFLTKTTEHMKARGARTCAWHDMMVDKEDFKKRYGIVPEPANGQPNTLERIPKDLTVMYWHYEDTDEHPVFKALQGTGNDLWCAVWYNVPGMYKLFKECKRIGVTHVMPCLWGFPNHQLGLGAGADFSWNLANPQGKGAVYFDFCNDRLFYPPLPPAKADALLVGKEAPVALADAVLAEFPQPWKASELVAGGQLFMTAEGTYEMVYCKDLHTDTHRSANGIWFYTPAYGETTKTNIWGQEMAVVDGMVTAVSGSITGNWKSEKGSMAIPKDGMVMSMRAVFEPHYQRGNGLRQTLRPGTKLLLYQVPEEQPKLEATDFAVPQGTTSFRVQLTMERPFLRNWPLLDMVVTLADGTEACQRITGYSFLSPRPLNGGWKGGMLRAVPEMPIVEFSYAAKDKEITKISFSPHANGAYAKLTVLQLATFNLDSRKHLTI